MTAPYVDGFARAYDRFWYPYPQRAAQALLRLHESTGPAGPAGPTGPTGPTGLSGLDGPRRVLDIGCGSGIVAERFLDAGFEVTGFDHAEAMLERARDRLGDRAELRLGDATDFDLGVTFPFAFSTYDIPNHLRTAEQIRRYLECAFRAVSPGGLFAFDFATVRGLRGMNLVQVREDDEALLVFRGALNEDEGAGFYRISGAVRADDGRYDRFATTITNIVVNAEETLKTMAQIGWTDAYLASPEDLTTPFTDDVETVPRLFIIAHHP